MRYVEFAQDFKEFKNGDRRFIRDTARANELVDSNIVTPVENPYSHVGAGPVLRSWVSRPAPNDTTIVVDVY